MERSIVDGAISCQGNRINKVLRLTTEDDVSHHFTLNTQFLIVDDWLWNYENVLCPSNRSQHLSPLVDWILTSWPSFLSRQPLVQFRPILLTLHTRSLINHVQQHQKNSWAPEFSHISCQHAAHPKFPNDKISYRGDTSKPARDGPHDHLNPKCCRMVGRASSWNKERCHDNEAISSTVVFTSLTFLCHEKMCLVRICSNFWIPSQSCNVRLVRLVSFVTWLQWHRR